MRRAEPEAAASLHPEPDDIRLLKMRQHLRCKASEPERLIRVETDLCSAVHALQTSTQRLRSARSIFIHALKGSIVAPFKFETRSPGVPVAGYSSLAGR